ncbi:hypothetical protein R3P38DRAFT_2788364 [Favolaschia claudopus]|uniref:Uncharacterized protein n=1 Tax=Favolaschia claudopus TaxID=2862362 RepID=A0AAW0AJV1_9AGAR
MLRLHRMQSLRRQWKSFRCRMLMIQMEDIKNVKIHQNAKQPLTADDSGPNPAAPGEEDLTPLSEDEPVAPAVRGRRRGAAPATRGRRAPTVVVPEDDNGTADDETEPVAESVQGRGRGKKRGRGTSRGRRGRGT